jgi:hypothetical protein
MPDCQTGFRRPREETMNPFDSNPRPEEFPLGSAESRAAARLLVEKRNTALIPVALVQISNMGAPMVIECDPNLAGSDSHSWMTRQELETKQREYAKCEAAWYAQIELQRSWDSAEAPAVALPDVPSVPQGEKTPSTPHQKSQGVGTRMGRSRSRATCACADLSKSACAVIWIGLVLSVV